MTDETLPDAAKTLLELAVTQAVSVRATLTPSATRDERALRALAIVGRGGVEVGAVIGEGGMSVVHRGTQLALGREVAVKILRDGSDVATVRMMREAWITGALEHPSVIPVHDIVLDPQKQPQIVLKKVTGAVWSNVMHDPDQLRQRFGAGDAIDWNIRTLMQVANAVHFAHSRGILHRDLKSENVMLGEFGEIYVVDWGLAVALADDGTGRLPLVSEVDTISGTPAYMAPEMLDGTGERLSVRTDVYLLGAVLFEIVIGEPPHLASGGLPAVLTSILRSPPPIRDDVPAELAGILRRALARDPGDRYASAEELRLALAAFLEHRASTVVAVEATEKLTRLEATCAEPTALGAPSGRYDLFGECRFGFREALRSWPENPVARDGLRRAVVVMTERELAEGNPRAAELILDELDEAPPALVERVRSAKEKHELEQKRLAALDRDLDPRIGRRARLQISAALGVLWTAIPWAGWFIERNDPHANQKAPLLSSTVMLVLAGAIALRAKRALSRTALNRSLVRAVGVVLAAQVVVYAVTLFLGISYEHTRVVILCLYAACAALTAAAVERRLWPSATGYLVAVIAATLQPPYAWPIESIANLLLTVNVLIVWRDEAPAKT